MAAPTNEISEVPTRRVFLAWKVSEADEIKGQMTACTRESEFGTQVCVRLPSRLVPMYESCIISAVGHFVAGVHLLLLEGLEGQRLELDSAET